MITASSESEDLASACSTRFQVGVACPLTAMTSFPATRPAAAAALSAATSPINGLTPVSPSMNTSQKATMANSRLNSGPATTTAERTGSDWRLKARDASAGLTGPSLSSSILT